MKEDDRRLHGEITTKSLKEITTEKRLVMTSFQVIVNVCFYTLMS